MTHPLTPKEINKELEAKSWYRLVKVLAIILIALAFILPVIFGKNIEAGILNGFISGIIWTIIFVVGRKALVYVVFGKTHQVKNLKNDGETDEDFTRRKGIERRKEEKRILVFIVWVPLIFLGVFLFLAIILSFIGD